MTVTTDKLAETVAARMAAARQRLDTKMAAYSGQAGRLAARDAARQTATLAGKRLQLAGTQVQDRMRRARFLVQDELAPRAANVVDTAMTRSAPLRDEAMRRARLAALALREGDVPTAASKRRRWPVAVGFLALGGALGAAGAWVSQAGKPMQLTPYPLPSDEDAHRTDMTSDPNADHPA
jgi:hypothetical protein